MDLHSWLKGLALLAFTLLPFFATWACAVLWWRSRSGWGLAALIGTSLALAGIVGMWARNFYHYSSVQIMMKDNANPNVQLTAALEMCVVFGFFIAALALVGYARSLPRHLREPTAGARHNDNPACDRIDAAKGG